MMVFAKLELPEDNCRKALIEMRPNVSGAYKGIINCRGYDEAIELATLVQGILSEEISNGISVIVKRGCTEYSAAYPEYGNLGGSDVMEYKPEWQQVEDVADERFTYRGGIPDKEMYNRSSYNIQDANIMYYWLQYASAIGDMNYLVISGGEVQPLANVDRPVIDIPVVSGQAKPVKKIGRNDPCICGSGKKYKRCCMLN